MNAPGSPPAETTRPDWRRRLAAWWRLPHPAAILVVLGATAAFAALFSGGSPDGAVLAPMLLGMLGGQLAIGAFNEIADRNLDALSKPWKPIPSGLVTVRQAAALGVAGLVVMAVAGAALGPLPLTLLAAGTGIGIAYDLWLKRGRWAWAAYAVALPLLPVWVMACLGPIDARAWLFFLLGAPGTSGVYLAQSAADAESDRAAGLDNLGARLGSRMTAATAVLLVGVTVVLALAAALLLPGLGVNAQRIAAWSAAALVLVAVGGAMAASGSAAGIRRCFVPLALALAAVGVGWVQSGG